MPWREFEPGSPRPQSKSDDLDCLAIGPALLAKLFSFDIGRLNNFLFVCN